MTEIWKSLKGIVECGDNYEVSNLGRVKSNGQRKTILKPTINSKGYHRIGLMLGSKKKNYRVHRLVALAFIPNPDDKPEVNHKDGNKDNNVVDNLEWSTHSENVQHSFDNNLNHTKGEGSHKAKLTEEDVLEVRKLYDTGKYTHRELGKMFDVNHSLVGKIVRRENWKHI
jgi:hypothetical protein